MTGESGPDFEEEVCVVPDAGAVISQIYIPNSAKK
jgi:hypothetical protein